MISSLLESVLITKVLDALLDCSTIPFFKKAYSTPPEPIKDMVSLAQILIVAAAVIAPGLAISPGLGNAFTLTKTSFEGTEQVTPNIVLTVILR